MPHSSPWTASEVPPWFGFVARYSRWLVPLVYLACAAAFVSDMTRTNVLAYGIFYVPLIATALFHESARALWFLTFLASALVVAGAFFPAVDADLPDLIGNRILSILAILATAVFVLHARATQARLAAEIRRAEAAEGIKTEVFTKLSEEMRSPLHALLGLLNLMIAGSRPDQSDALGRVRNGGKQLLATIDNLIELTQIDGRTLETQPVDIAALARVAADDSQVLAAEYGVAVDLAADDAAAVALGDPWAVRRILDNLVANAVQRAAPGTAVRIAVRQADRRVTALVGDAGADGLGAPTAGEGAGLALSERLAAAMNGRLTIEGAALRLTLPQA